MAQSTQPVRAPSRSGRLRATLGSLASRLDWVPGVRRATTNLVSLGLRTGFVPYRPAGYAGEPWAPADATGGDLDYIGSLSETFRYSLLLGYISYFGGHPRILDVGCGKGHLRARMTGIDFARYVGVDRSEVAIDAAGTVADDRTTFLATDVETLALDDFDVVVLNEALYYLNDPVTFLDRVRDALPTGGLVLTSMWRHGVDDYLWQLLDARFERLDLVHVHNPATDIAKRGWRVACHRAR